MVVRPGSRFMAVFVAFAIVISAGLAGACGGEDDDSGNGSATSATSSSSPAGSGAAEDITVFAASSLTASFEDIKTEFEAVNEGASVTFNFAGSPALRTQLQEGAEADIYTPADTNNMEQAQTAELVVDDGQTFTRNRLAVIVSADNPGNVTALQDLSRGGLKLVLAAEEVPVGRYARESISKMQADGSYGETFEQDVLANVVSNEPNVKAVVTKVQLGEADAGIVYVTDVTADVEADISSLEIPDAYNIIAEYPIAVTTTAANPEAAQLFIDFVLSDEGQAILAEYGFEPVD